MENLWSMKCTRCNIGSDTDYCHDCQTLGHDPSTQQHQSNVMNQQTQTQSPDLKSKSLSELAGMIRKDWAGKVYFGAKPYLSAMSTLNSIDDEYGMDSGKSIVAYFLANATTWRGQVARDVKKELNRRLK